MLLALLAGGVSPAADAAPACEALQVRTEAGRSVLHRVRLPDFAGTRVGVLPHRVNALGYSPEQGWAYGIAEGFDDGGHVVALRPEDPPLDLGPVIAGRGDTPWNVLDHPTAGAVRGNRWYVGEGDRLYTVDIDPGSPTYRHVLSSIALEERHGPFSLDDFDVGPDGFLRGVAQTYTGTPAVVRLDLSTGVAEPVLWLPTLPPDSYGSVVIDPDGALHFTANRGGGVYRVEADGQLVELAELAPTSSSDAAGCLRRTPPPPPRPPPPLPPPPPTGASEPAPPTTSSVPPEPAEVPSPTASPTRAPVPPPVEPTPESEKRSPAVEPEEAEVDEAEHSTEEKRRWAVAGLVLLIGGSAAVRRLGRG
ncbi:hypothetical protein EIL87_02610 [Saccharopolyspora rhizosphaerae]|uniref:DUF6923 domain-containing protein n=1 Tax=Saccharopolyspora rhizosphaerae TaxID=2492662 RepID=A0A3R8PAC5_9PSEU|nr:hypothetical protein EIL87_02610 [Saccharopolyspora rhizosphaerae]